MAGGALARVPHPHQGGTRRGASPTVCARTQPTVTQPRRNCARAPLPTPGEESSDEPAESTTKKLKFLRPGQQQLTPANDDVGLASPLDNEQSKYDHHPRAVALTTDVNGYRVQDLDPCNPTVNPVPVPALTAIEKQRAIRHILQRPAHNAATQPDVDVKIPIMEARTKAGLPARPKFSTQHKAVVAASSNGAFKLKELERAETRVAEYVNQQVRDEYMLSEAFKSQDMKLVERGILVYDTRAAACATGASEETIKHIDATLAHLDPRAYELANNMDEKDRDRYAKNIPQLSKGGSEEVKYSETIFCDENGEVATQISQVQYVLDRDNCLTLWAGARRFVVPNAPIRKAPVWKPIPPAILETAVVAAKVSEQYAEAMATAAKKDKPPWKPKHTQAGAPKPRFGLGKEDRSWCSNGYRGKQANYNPNFQRTATPAPDQAAGQEQEDAAPPPFRGRGRGRGGREHRGRGPRGRPGRRGGRGG